jgi:starch phosphorylase
VAEMLTQGVDVWINTPRRPWEACGTSGMKVLVNGGLNLSELEGWWAEAYSPDVGWALGDGDVHGPEYDARDAEALYRLLEDNVIPEFYDRDSSGLPRRWLEKLRRSMARLAPQFSSTRMVQDYVDRFYIRAAEIHRERQSDRAQVARDLRSWERGLKRNWSQLHFGPLRIGEDRDGWNVSIAVYLGDIDPDGIQVGLYADGADGLAAEFVPMTRGDAIPGTKNGYVYNGKVGEGRPVEDYTARATPRHESAILPAELPLIAWQR